MSSDSWLQPPRSERLSASPSPGGGDTADRSPPRPAPHPEKKRQNSCHNIFDSEDEEFQKDFFSDFSRPKSVGTIPKCSRKLSANVSDPCLLSACLPPDDISTGELSSHDSGIPEERLTMVSAINQKLIPTINRAKLAFVYAFVQFMAINYKVSERVNERQGSCASCDRARRQLPG